MIEIINLEKKFGEKTLFHNFNLTIQNGDFIVLSGVSGSGKTTLLNMIGGIEKPDCGKIIVDGDVISQKRCLADFFAYKVGFLFQNFALIENKTVRENHNLVQKKARSGILEDEALHCVGLENVIDTKVYKLSGGEQQRVALARLLYKKCDIILADEPTGSLDRQNAQMVINFLHTLSNSGKTVVLVTHDEKIIVSERNVVKL